MWKALGRDNGTEVAFLNRVEPKSNRCKWKDFQILSTQQILLTDVDLRVLD